MYSFVIPEKILLKVNLKYANNTKCQSVQIKSKSSSLLYLGIAFFILIDGNCNTHLN